MNNHTTASETLHETLRALQLKLYLSDEAIPLRTEGGAITDQTEAAQVALQTEAERITLERSTALFRALLAQAS
jgi:hypothetical protein